MSLESIQIKIANITDGGRNTAAELRAVLTDMTTTLTSGISFSGTTDSVPEGGSNLYYTDGRVDSKLVNYTLTGHTHNISDITGFTDNSTDWNTAYNGSITGITVTGITTKTISLFKQDGSLIQANFTDNSGSEVGELVTGVTFNVSTGDLDLTTNSGSTISTNLDGRYLTGYTDTNDNDYITGATFNILNGLLEFTRLSGGTFNVDLDNRYSLTGHTHSESDITDLQDYALNTVLSAHTGNTSNVHNVTLEQARAQDNRLLGNVNFDGNSIIDITEINFKLSGTYSNVGKMYYDDEDYSIYIDNELGHPIHIGRDLQILFVNNTGLFIPKGTVVSIESSNGVLPSVTIPRADIITNIDFNIMVTVNDVLDGEIGLGTTVGKVYLFNTSGFTNGDKLYLSPTTAGTLTNVKPDFPNYEVLVGYVILGGEPTDGEIMIQPQINRVNSLENFWNGTVRESFTCDVTSDGTTITARVNPINNIAYLNLMTSAGRVLFASGTTISLISGTDTNPQLNYLYIPHSTSLLTISLTGWPIEEHVRIGTFLVQSAISVQSDGILKSHVWHDHIQSTNSQGHLSHITERIRIEGTRWVSGSQGSINTDGTNIYVTATSGITHQLHPQTFNAIDTSSTDYVSVINDPINPYVKRTNLNAITTTSSGDSLTDTSYSLVMWGSVNTDGTSRVFINLPSGTYSSSSLVDARNDVFGYANFSIPSTLSDAGFLIAKFNIQNIGGVYSILSTEDLRGKTNISTGNNGGVLSSQNDAISVNTMSLSAHTGDTNVHYTMSAITITESQISDLQSYALTGHTHTVSDITDFPSDLSAFSNGPGYLTGYTDTNTTVTGTTVTGAGTKTLNIYQSDGSVITTTFTDISGSGGGTGESITGSTFNTATGDLSLITNSGSTIVTSLDGRYLTGYTDTNDNIYVTGATFNISDGILTFTNISGGTFNVDLDDRYSLTGHTHSEYALDSALVTHTGDTTIHYTKSSINLSDLGSTGHTHAQYLTGYTDTNDNDYVTGATFNTTDGVLTFSRLSGNTFTVDLDDRYSLTGHTHSNYALNSDLTSHTGDTSVHYVMSAITVTESQISDLRNYQLTSEKGAANGYAELDASGFVPSSQLPAYVDDVLEFADLASFPTTGTTGIVYIAIDSNITYRWSGSIYVPIGSDLALGETSSTAYRGDRGKIAYDHTFDSTIHYPQSGITITESQISDLGPYTDDTNLNSHTGDTSIHYTKTSINLSDLGSTGHTHNLSLLNNDIGFITGYTDTNDNIYVTGSTFNTGDGVLTFTNISGGTFTVDLDGRYLTSETDSQTLSFSANSGNLSISSGNTINLDGRYSLTGHTHTEADITDLQDYALNNALTAHTSNSTIHFTKNSINLSDLGSSAHTHTVSNISDFPTNVSYFTNDLGYLTGYTPTIDTNDYITSGSFNTTNGNLTLTRLSGGTVVTNLDNRYSLSSHTHSDYALDSNFINHTGDTSIHFTKNSINLSDLGSSAHTHTVSEVTDFPTNISYFTNDSGYITGYTNTNDYVTSGSFNTTNGNLTLTRLSGGTVITNLDNRYSLTGHTHPDYALDSALASHTGDTSVHYIMSAITITESQISDLQSYALTGHTHIIGDITDFTNNSTNWDTAYDHTITGITITGAGTKTVTLQQRDGSTIITNFTDLQGSGGGSGEEITGTTFNTSDGNLTLTTNSGSTIVTSLDGRYAYDSALASHTGDTTIHFTKSSINLSDLGSTGHTHTISNITDFPTNISYFTNDSGYLTGYTPTVNTNDYVTSGAFNTTNGNLTLTRLSGGTVVTNLDNRYSLTGHTHPDYVLDSNFNSHTGDTSIHFTQGSISITESQISDLQSYSLTGHTHTASQITDFSDAVTGNTAVLANTAKTGITETQAANILINNAKTGITLSQANAIISNTSGLNAHTGDTSIHFTKGSINLSDLGSTGHTHSEYALDSALTSHTGDTSLHFTQGSISITESQISDLQDYALNTNLTGHTSDTSIHFTKGSINLSDLATTAHTHTVSNISDFPTVISYFTNDNGYITGFTDTNDYVTSGTFNTTNGNLTLTRLSGGTVVTNLDNRYSLTGHTHTDYALDSNFNSHTGDTSIHFTKNSINLSDLAATGHTHIISEITDFPNVISYFTNDLGYITGYTDTNDNIYVTGSTFNITDGVLTFTNISGGTFTVDLDGRYLTGYTETSNTDDYVSSAAFNTTNGILTLTRISGGTVTVDLDDRYSLTGHTHPEYALNSALTSHTGDTSIHFTKGSINLSDLGNSGHTHIVSEITDFPTNVSYFTNDLGYITGYTDTNTYLTGATVTGTTTKSINLFQSDGSLIQATFTDSIGGGSGESVTGSTFNISTGDLTLTTNSGSTITSNLDGRYSLTGHTHSEFALDSALASHTGDTTIHFTKNSINLSDLASSAHTHTISEITDFPTALVDTLVSSGGESQWVLSSTPSDSYPEQLYINGLFLVKGTDWTRSGDTITFLSGTTPVLAGEIFSYFGNSIPVSSPILKQEFIFSLSAADGVPVSGTSAVSLRVPNTFVCTDVRLEGDVADTTSNVTVDVLNSGTSIFDTSVSIDANEETSVTATTPFAFVGSASSVTINDNNKITFVISNITDLKGLKIQLIGHRG